ncbi:hypothetical protein [Leifsonia sp. 2MCAF36]
MGLAGVVVGALLLLVLFIVAIIFWALVSPVLKARKHHNEDNEKSDFEGI